MAHRAPDRRIASTENIAVIISLTLIVWLQHINPNCGKDWDNFPISEIWA
jgi:hypothetical protein